MTDTTQEDVRLDSQQIAQKPAPLAHRTTRLHSDVDALVERYRDAISFHGIEEALAVVVELATIAKDAEAWSKKRSIVSGPIRYEVLGAENVKNHEVVHDFIEVLSPPSIEATNAISAHTNLMQQLSNALALLTAYQSLGSPEYLAAALVEADKLKQRDVCPTCCGIGDITTGISMANPQGNNVACPQCGGRGTVAAHDNAERLREEGL